MFYDWLTVGNDNGSGVLIETVNVLGNYVRLQGISVIIKFSWELSVRGILGKTSICLYT